MLLTLNDDCLQKLCEYLKLIDHISLLNTCERLRTVVQCYYKTHNKVTLGWNIEELESEDARRILKDFGAHIEPYIEEISFKEIKGELIWLRYLPSLDKIKHLKIYYINFDCEHKNYFEKICTQLKTFELNQKQLEHLKVYDFSNLTNLTIKGLPKLSGFEDTSKVLDVNAKTFPKLENLSLDECEINFENLKDFKNLKTLKISRWDLTPFNPKLIFSLPTLEKLEIMCFRKFKNIDGIASCENLKELVIHEDQLQDLQLDELLKLKNFQKIKFSWSFILRMPAHPNLVYHAIESVTMRSIWNQPLQLCTKFRDVYSLKLLMPDPDFLKSFSTSLNYSIEMLKLCKNLRILELCGSMKIAAILLEEAINKVYKCNFFEERQTKPLMIYCNVGGMEGEKEGVTKIMKLSLPKFIQIFWRSRLTIGDIRHESTLDCNWVVKNY